MAITLSKSPKRKKYFSHDRDLMVPPKPILSPALTRRLKLLPLSLCGLLSIKGNAEDTLPRDTRSILQPEMEAAVQPGGFNAADHATGNWNGLRDRFFQNGLEVFGFYNNIISGNVSGGRDSGHATYDHDIWVGLKFDLDKLAGWRGARLVVSGINRFGDDLTNEYIGSIYSTQQLVGGQQTFLYQLYLEQKLFVDQLTLKLGRFGASDDFNTSTLYGYSLNNGINGDIRNVLFDTRFSAYPFATWAATAFYNPTPHYSVKLGIFQTSEGMFENNDNGLNFGIGKRDGFTSLLEVGWSPEFAPPHSAPPRDNERVIPSSDQHVKGMSGHYWVGVTYSQWDLYPRFGGGFEDHSYGFYAHADQMVYREKPGSDHGLTAFAASGYYPQKDISIVPFQINAGLNYKGLFAERGEDHTMVHFIYGGLSREYTNVTRLPGQGDPKSEKIIEAAHRFQVTPWSYIQPDVQYVVTPGGTGDLPDAVVIGAQMGIAF